MCVKYLPFMDDEKFIAGLNGKNEAAWQQLYMEYYAPLCAYAERLAKGNWGVEDIVQDCMLELWNSSFQFPNVKALTAWLYQVVYNRTLNAMRDRANSHRLLEGYAREMYSEDEAVDFAAEETAVARLRKALRELTRQQQEIIRLTLDGMKVKEVAEALGVSDNTVKMQKKRAYTTLHDRLGKNWNVLLVFFFKKR